MRILILFLWVIILAVFVVITQEAGETHYQSNGNEYEFEYRSVGLCIFLSIITCGIYFFYWFVRIVKQVKEFHGDYSSCAKEVWLNILVPFYGWYWLYTRNKQMYLDAYNRGGRMKDSSASCLLLAIFRLGLISYAVMQNNMNHYTEMQRIKAHNMSRPQQMPVSSHVNIAHEPYNRNVAPSAKQEINSIDKLKELQSMLKEELISQEDYDMKKQEILKDM